MSEEWRIWLYPFGFLSGIFFGLRFLVQWLQSERAGKSIVPALFWKLSIVGNLLLFAHSFIQIHFPLCLVQALNIVLFWRNLNLMQPKKKQVSFQTVLTFLVTVGLGTVFLFAYQGAWLETPHSFSKVTAVSWWAHVIGIVGIASYSIRFWIQWWLAETNKTSELFEIFWWLSLTGSVFCTIYFYLMNDLVNLVGPLLSFIPYGRNLWLILRAKPARERG
jgi:lipid-A-disaccharide synthase